ncbi:tryptophan synthase subunit alpha [Gulosibacter chungangensis]|uniref:Tryptophan synthase alpha chain n=1 Tax=Gulosibacter chungangensis TaxID=979746 RepID=A0A7J5BEL6_9MICO|nr:tryptophan synthase subunit alpha [Gulosibacter chungangensis]KAB1644094.1 tryptophan synthase subunit alpha [Gulosibacter chungangensis]
MTNSASQVESTLDRIRSERRGALIGYLPVGFPDLDTSVEAAITLARNGVDIIEFGVPYSDPVMDGPVIQAACQQALSAGFHTAQIFDAVRRVRAEVDVPILIMGYYNLILQHGVEQFAADLAAAGGAGCITPDLIPDEAGEWIAAAEKHNLDRVFLAAPTSSDERLESIIKSSRGFVYTVSTMGVTGARRDLDRAARVLTDRLHNLGCEHACVGIGISTGEQVAAVLEYAEGAIVGSALVRALAEGGLESLAEVTRSLAEGTRN